MYPGWKALGALAGAGNPAGAGRRDDTRCTYFHAQATAHLLLSICWMRTGCRCFKRLRYQELTWNVLSSEKRLSEDSRCLEDVLLTRLERGFEEDPSLSPCPNKGGTRDSSQNKL